MPTPPTTTSRPVMPLRTPMLDSQGHLTRPWVIYFEQSANGELKPGLVNNGGGTGGGTTGGGGGSTAGAPGDVSGIQVDGYIDPINCSINLTVGVTPPTGAFTGCHLYLEVPDQSANAPVKVGATAVGSAAVTGTWAPIDLGIYSYVSDQQPWTVTWPLPPQLDPEADYPARLYALSFNNTFTATLVEANQSSPTPNLAFTLYTLDDPNAKTSGTNVTAICGPVTASVMPNDNSTGKLKTPVLVMVGSVPGTVSGWCAKLVLTWGTDDPTDVKNQHQVGTIFNTAGPVYGSPDGIPIVHSFALDTPNTTTRATVWAVSGLVDGKGNYRWNKLVPGITPSSPLSIGTTSGTIDAASAMLSSLEASMSVVSGLLGVSALGVTNAKLADGSVSTGKVQGGAVTNPLLGSAAVGTINIQGLAVTNPLLAGACVAATNLSGSSVTSAALAGSSVTSTALANAAVIAAKLAGSSVTATAIANAAVGSAAIAAAAIGTAAIATGAITQALIANAAVGTAQIIDGSILNAKIGVAAVADANIGSCNISKLIAGTATFSGDAVFSRGGGYPQVSIASTGLFLTGNNFSSATTVAMNSTTINITAGTYSSLSLQAGTVTLSDTSTGAQLQMTSSGITLGNTANLNTLQITAAGVSMYAGMSYASMSAGTFSISGGGFNSMTLTTAAGGVCLYMNGGPGYGVFDIDLTSTGGPQLSLGPNISPMAITLSASLAGDVLKLGDNYSQIQMAYAGKLVINNQQVVGMRQTGPGTPSFASLANVQSWCSALLTALQTHGLVT